MDLKISQTLPGFEYYVKGSDPKLLIHAGTHGDEYEVVDLVTNALKKYEDKLPDFLYVPKVSPSAVAAKTRFNARGFDVNRIFFRDSDDPEVIENLKILYGYKFDLMVSFHEDPDYLDYYIYDQSFSAEENKKVKLHNEHLKAYGIQLLNGIDDPLDSHLGYEFKDGYKKFIDDAGIKNNGSTTVWAMSEKVTKEALTPEIPGKLSFDQKKVIVETFFEKVLLGKSASELRF